MKEFMTIVKTKAIKVEKYNTNNSWGFGGAVGKRYIFKDGTSLVKASACYRHLPSKPFARFEDNEDNRVFCDNKKNRSIIAEIIEKK